jgi:hypothetical protein
LSGKAGQAASAFDASGSSAFREANGSLKREKGIMGLDRRRQMGCEPERPARMEVSRGVGEATAAWTDFSSPIFLLANSSAPW